MRANVVEWEALLVHACTFHALAVLSEQRLAEKILRHVGGTGPTALVGGEGTGKTRATRHRQPRTPLTHSVPSTVPQPHITGTVIVIELK